MASPNTPRKNAKYANITSKIGSLDNISHSPSGGSTRILDKKTTYDTAVSKVGSKEKLNHTPGGIYYEVNLVKGEM